MASITHLKAQNLLQAAADSALAPMDEKSLNIHLEECEECRQYARRLSKLQDDLRRVMRYHWDQNGAQFSADEIRNRSASARVQAYNLQTLGKFSIVMAVLTLMFILAVSFSSRLNGIPAAISGLSLTPEKPVITPTPTIKRTVTDSANQKCSDIAYVVQENDTLDSIAARHSVSKESIKGHNGLSTDTLTVNMVLVIPLCEGTPAGSTTTPTMTTTATP
jgi:LysM repeat protein